eukprot:8191584-Karenia_brevis.AAC.1
MPSPFAASFGVPRYMLPMLANFRHDFQVHAVASERNHPFTLLEMSPLADDLRAIYQHYHDSFVPAVRKVVGDWIAALQIAADEH